jgi:hypothetical protein
MSAAPSEPEKYSIDEMMNRLKQSSSETAEDGELVTRADGTQAVRVRKRKRRSTQPHKQNAQRSRRARIIQITAAFILVVVAALTVGIGIIYANSSPFRESLVHKIQDSSGATTEIQQFRMNPKTANANYLTMDWPQGNVLKNMNFRSLNAEIFPSSFLGKSMDGEEVTAVESKVTLQYPAVDQPKRKTPASSQVLPINFGRYRSRMLDIILGSGPTMISLGKTEGSFTSSNIKGRPQLALSKGEFNIPNWPKFRLDRALIEFNGDEADILSLRLLHEKENRGSFQLRGRVSPYQPEQLTTLDVSLESFEISGLLGPALGRLVQGEVDTLPEATNVLSFRPTANSTAKLDVSLGASPNSAMKIHDFPFLSAISQALGDDEWFLAPVFEDQGSANVIREAGVVTLRDIKFESKNRMAIRGQISLSAKNALSGTLEVGVSEAMLLGSKHARLINMFGAPTEGFRWITLQLGGPVNAPTDNFKALYDASKTTTSSPSPIKDGGSSFEELTRPK